jgi:DNA-binding CsgD family transcriptional regulator
MLILARMEPLPRWHVLKMKSKSPLSPSLSPRQKDCLQLIADGHTILSISIKLNISERMVHFHLRRVRDKLNAVSTPQAVHIAVREGLLDAN